jgi:hypothetical protein
MKKPIIVTATQAELDALLAVAKPTFSIAQYELLKGIFATFVYVQTSRTFFKNIT